MEVSNTGNFAQLRSCVKVEVGLGSHSLFHSSSVPNKPYILCGLKAPRKKDILHGGGVDLCRGLKQGGKKEKKIVLRGRQSRVGDSGRVSRTKDTVIDLYKGPWAEWVSGFQARSKDQEILEEGGGAGPSLLPRRDHE